VFGSRGDVRGKSQGDDHERLAAIRAYDEHVAISQPFVEFAKSGGARLDLDNEIAAEKRDAEIAGKSAAGTPAQRYALGGKSGTLQELDETAL
jgi:hypothetical protein